MQQMSELLHKVAATANVLRFRSLSHPKLCWSVRDAGYFCPSAATLDSEFVLIRCTHVCCSFLLFGTSHWSKRCLHLCAVAAVENTVRMAPWLTKVEVDKDFKKLFLSGFLLLLKQSWSNCV